MNYLTVVECEGWEHKKRGLPRQPSLNHIWFNFLDYGIESITTAVSPEAELSSGIESIKLLVSLSVSSEVVLLQDAASKLNARNKENSLNKLFICVLLNN